MDDMYLTIQQACRQATKAHRNELRTHIIFREVGLWRIKPADEIAEIDQRAIYGWTVSSRPLVKPGESINPEDWQPCVKVRRQFYKGDCYYDPETNIKGLKTRNRYGRAEIYDVIRNGQQF